jgi:hypothetical protein
MRKIAINVETQKRNASRSLPVRVLYNRPLQVDYRLGSWPENPIIFYFMFKLTEFYRQKSLNIAFSIAQDPIQAQNSFKQTNKDRNKTTKCFVLVKAKLRKS